MISAPDTLPDDPAALKLLLAEVLRERESNLGTISQLQKQVALLRQRLFGRKSEQTVDPTTPQLALFNEVESLAEPLGEAADSEIIEEVVAPSAKRRGKRKPLVSADVKLPHPSEVKLTHQG